MRRETIKKDIKNESLDPNDWEEFRRTGTLMLDQMIDHMRTVRERPAWRSVPSMVKEELDEPIPWDGSSLEDVYSIFKDNILPYPTGNAHPRFFGWVMGNGTPTGALADFLSSVMNCHVAGYDQAATVIENKVLEWLVKLIGYPSTATGLLVSGGTMANINGLLVARNEIADFDIREEGVQSSNSRLTVYASSETHSWVFTACEIMGLGRRALRRVPVNQNYQIDIDALQRMIDEDVRNGCRPICVIANVGTVNCGAIDDLDALGKITRERSIWLHVDGAFGSMAAWAPEAKRLVQAQVQSDSIAFDLHKWGYMPYEVACVLIKKPEAHKDAFANEASYLSSSNRGISVETTRFADRGIQLSRSFRALKVWMSMKEQGVNRIGQAIDRNIRQAKFLGKLVEENDQTELLAPVSLNVVCFRFVSDVLTDLQLNELNQEVLLRVQESGYAVPSQTFFEEKFAIRVCITNHRSIDQDFVGIVDEVVRHGNNVMKEMIS